MNFFIQSHSTDDYDKNEYISFSIKCCIGCMPAYTHGDYVSFNNENDAPE